MSRYPCSPIHLPEDHDKQRHQQQHGVDQRRKKEARTARPGRKKSIAYEMVIAKVRAVAKKEPM